MAGLVASRVEAFEGRLRTFEENLFKKTSGTPDEYFYAFNRDISDIFQCTMKQYFSLLLGDSVGGRGS